MYYSLSVNLFLIQCWSIYSLDQDFSALDEQGVRRVQQTQGSTSVQVPVSYKCDFTNLWTKESHPARFPDDDHWSSRFIASHNKGYTMWSTGTNATKGVENVAEFGGTTNLRKELDAAGSKVKEYGSIPLDLNMDRGHKFISIISMIAPSPDWFSGLDSYRPIKNRKWLQNFTVETYPYDAGTENGDNYGCSNAATNPQETITQFTKDNVPSNGIFLNQAEDDILPVARWSCTLNELACEESEGARFFRRRIKDENGVMTVRRQKCRWLAQKKQASIDKFCDRSSPDPRIPSASEACRVTCGTCVE